MMPEKLENTSNHYVIQDAENQVKLKKKGYTKSEALEQVPFQVIKDATQAWKNAGKPMTGNALKEFMSEYLRANTKFAQGIGCSITVEAGTADTRERPYTITDIKNESGKRKYKTGIQGINPETGEILFVNFENKAAAKEAAKALYLHKLVAEQCNVGDSFELIVVDSRIVTFPCSYLLVILGVDSESGSIRGNGIVEVQLSNGIVYVIHICAATSFVVGQHLVDERLKDEWIQNLLADYVVQGTTDRVVYGSIYKRAVLTYIVFHVPYDHVVLLEHDAKLVRTAEEELYPRLPVGLHEDTVVYKIILKGIIVKSTEIRIKVRFRNRLCESLYRKAECHQQKQCV